MSQQSTLYRWARNGAILGLIVPLFDLIFEWRGPQFYPWAGEGLAHNVGLFAGSMLGGALIGLVAGSLRDRSARRAQRLT